MVSKLEDLFLRYHNGTTRVRTLLLERLDGFSLRKLRLVSRILHRLLERYPDRMFKRLFISAPLSDHIDIDSLKAVAPSCRTLTVRLGYDETHSPQELRGTLQKQRPTVNSRSLSEQNTSGRGWWRTAKKALGPSNRDSTPSSVTTSIDRVSYFTRSTTSLDHPESSESSEASSRNIWTELLSHCKELENIEILTNGEPAWPGRTSIELELVHLRVALESVDLPKIRRVSLTPIHAMGIVHLRWSGFAAFGDVSINPSIIWSNLHTLDLQLKNPLLAERQLSEPQQLMFMKIFHDYLRSFGDTLKCLRFVWLDGEGPSPITLDLEPELEGRRKAITWTALEEVWLGNVLMPHRTVRLLPERVARTNVRLKTLRSTHRHSRAMFEDDKAWLEVLLNFKPHGIERGRSDSQSSSVYSQ